MVIHLYSPYCDPAVFFRPAGAIGVPCPSGASLGASGRAFVRVVAAVALIGLAGCQAAHPSPPATQPVEHVDPALPHAKAERLVREAAAARRAGRKQEAREKLSDAARLDPASGQIQHCLGLVCHEQGNLREAATHFEQASRLLRSRVEPCYNLGLVLEKGGNYSAAVEAYERALHRQPDHLPTMENVCRVRIRLGRRDGQTLQLVRACLEREDRPEWVSWLNVQLASLEKTAAPAPATAPSIAKTEAPSAGSRPSLSHNHTGKSEETRS